MLAFAGEKACDLGGVVSRRKGADAERGNAVSPGRLQRFLHRKLIDADGVEHVLLNEIPVIDARALARLDIFLHCIG